jgi:hypothetical protein
MDAAYISAVSALAGSVIGGLTTGFTTLLNQRSQARAGMVAHELSRREDLVKDFIVAASTIYGDAIVNSEPKMPEIVDLYAMVSRMRVLNMPKSVARADDVMRSILDTYFSPNRTIADLREINENRRGRRSAEGLQRGGAGGDSRLRTALRRRAQKRFRPEYEMVNITCKYS